MFWFGVAAAREEGIMKMRCLGSEIRRENDFAILSRPAPLMFKGTALDNKPVPLILRGPPSKFLILGFWLQTLS